jgi:outer membrane lipoprotein-sorting protein
MKTLYSLVGLLILVLVTNEAFAANDEGLRIAQERKLRNTGWQDTVAETTMVLRNARGQEFERALQVFTLEREAEGDKSLTVFVSPKDVAGSAFLSYSNTEGPDDQWMYLPKLKRTKRISSPNKSGPFMSSEFAYEDMASFELKKYQFHYLRDDTYENQDVYVLEQTPVDEYSGYSKQIAWIDKVHYRLLKMEFYDRKGTFLKTLTLSDYKQYLDKYWRPHSSEMFNEQTGKSTVMYVENVRFKTGLRDSDFSKNSLQRVRVK